MTINEVGIRGSVASDDLLSYSHAQGSAIAKAAAINDAFEFTGVRAIAGPTVINGTVTGSIGGGILDESKYFTINGSKIAGFEVLANDSDGALVDAINARFDETGVLASLDIFHNYYKIIMRLV